MVYRNSILTSNKDSIARNLRKRSNLPVIRNTLQPTQSEKSDTLKHTFSNLTHIHTQKRAVKEQKEDIERDNFCVCDLLYPTKKFHENDIIAAIISYSTISIVSLLLFLFLLSFPLSISFAVFCCCCYLLFILLSLFYTTSTIIKKEVFKSRLFCVF